MHNSCHRLILNYLFFLASHFLKPSFPNLPVASLLSFFENGDSLDFPFSESQNSAWRNSSRKFQIAMKTVLHRKRAPFASRTEISLISSRWWRAKMLFSGDFLNELHYYELRNNGVYLNKASTQSANANRKGKLSPNLLRVYGEVALSFDDNAFLKGSGVSETRTPLFA